MRLTLSVLGFFLACVTASTFDDHTAPYGFYPNYFNPYYPPNRLAMDVDALRTLALGMGGGFTAAIPRPTETYVKILTKRITCSMSVTNRCSVSRTSRNSSRELEQPATPDRPSTTSNRDRGEEKENDTSEQFPIVPSVVQEIEATQLPVRDTRTADLQWLLTTPKSYQHQPQEVQSAFHSGPYNYVTPPFNRQYAPVGQQRQFPPFITNMFTVTEMQTSFHVKTFTLVPSCSVAGTLPQCPNGK